jgi:hypothetical protein
MGWPCSTLHELPNGKVLCWNGIHQGPVFEYYYAHGWTCSPWLTTNGTHPSKVNTTTTVQVELAVVTIFGGAPAPYLCQPVSGVVRLISPFQGFLTLLSSSKTWWPDTTLHVQTCPCNSTLIFPTHWYSYWDPTQPHQGHWYHGGVHDPQDHLGHLLRIMISVE